MVLHGLYDTFLDIEQYLAALLVGATSFVWLVFLVEWARQTELKASAPIVVVDPGPDTILAAMPSAGLPTTSASRPASA
jgi:hypothetical protein